MQAEAKKFAWDALQAVERITRFSAGKTFADYHGDELLRSAIERQFEIVAISDRRNRKYGLSSR